MPDDSLTDDEIKNGWTKESLAKYQKEREAAQSQAIDPTSEARLKARRPQSQVSYKPLRWRG